MFSGLRARLLISYFFLIIVMLGIITGTFVFILNTRASPVQPTYERLAAMALSLPLRDLWEGTGIGIVSPEVRLQRLISHLDEVAAELDTRILVIEESTRATLFDSADEFALTEVIDVRFQNYAIPARVGRGNDSPFQINARVGNFFDAENAEWLFLGLETLGIRRADYLLLFAESRPTQSLQAALSEFGTEILPLLLQAAFFGVLVAVALAVFISRNIAQSLQNVAIAAVRVSEGTYAPMPVTGPKEVRAVAEAFNHMTTEVQSEQQAQQDFLANVSHDLKTPLTSIQGFSQAILDGAAPDPMKAAQIIYDESSRLNRMVTELTDLARLQAGQLSMTMNTIDMGQLTTAIAQRLTIVALEKRIALHVDATSMPMIAGDGDRLAQVLTNLISNAINYTPEGGNVWVRTQLANGGVELIIQDDGVGIPASELPRIFERFYQVDKARGPRRGTGLGLAIVYEIIAAHGGRVTVSSPGVGKGSIFTVWLPSSGVNTVMRRR